MCSLWPLHWHEDKTITSRHWTVTYLCGWELEVEHHTSLSFVFALLIFLLPSVFVQDSFQTCLFESKCAKRPQFSKPIMWYNIIWYWNRVNLTDLTRVTHRTDNRWLVARVLVCTHVRTVHVNLAGCQRRLRVVKMTCGVKWMACVCRWWKNLKQALTCLRSYTHVHTHTNTLSPCTLTRSHTSHVPRCEKDGKAPPAKSLPKLPEVSFYVCRVSQSEGLFPGWGGLAARSW